MHYSAPAQMDMFINLWSKVFHRENGQKTFFWPSINIFDPIVSKNFGIVDTATTDHEALENCQNLVV